MNQLAERVAREKESYDGGDVFAESRKLQSRFYHVFQCPNTKRANSYQDTAVRKYASGADILDLGCLDGAMTPAYLAMKPKSLTGIDISEVGIAAAQHTYGEDARFLVADAHNMPFEDASFNLIVGKAILHHLDFPVAIREIARVLKPGGAAIFSEPLGDNPAARLVRRMTPRARTEDEMPLSRTQIRFADKEFGGEEHHFANLVSVPVAMATSLIVKRPDNPLLQLCDEIDVQLAKTPLRYWMRNVILVWRKFGQA